MHNTFLKFPLTDTRLALHKLKLYIILAIIGSSFFSCSKEDYEAQIPSYIAINSITLTTDYATQGSSSSNIVDAWVYVNDDLVGVYELPAKFPVLKEGNVTLKIFGGIKDNGITATRAQYVLYDPHVQKVNLVKDETIEIDAIVTYNDAVQFTWLEDFENSEMSFVKHQNSDTIVFKQSTVLKEGQFSGGIKLEPGMDFFEATSIPFADIFSGRQVYLELDFKTNEQVSVGIYKGTDQYLHPYGLNVASEWRKIYIKLATTINETSNSGELKVFFGMADLSDSPFISASPEVYIDNLKLVHY